MKTCNLLNNHNDLTGTCTQELCGDFILLQLFNTGNYCMKVKNKYQDSSFNLTKCFIII